MSSDMANFGAEQAALGSVLLAPDLAGAVFSVCPPSMFHAPKHGDLAAVLADLGSTADPQSVLTELLARGVAEKVGGGPYLHTLMERAIMPQYGPRHAADVRDAYHRRRLWETCGRAQQKLESAGVPMSLTVAELAAELDTAVDSLTPTNVEPPPTVTDLLAGEDTYDWLIPGLLERGERFMLTGAEGFGKTVLMRQLAVCAASGLHPFTAESVPPLSVLVVDCENSRAQNRRGYRPMVAVASRLRPDVDWDRLRIVLRPEGLDLTGPDDAAWLEGLMQTGKPDLLIVGPLYRLHAQNINDELAARQLVRTLDGLRVRYRCAVMIEAHAGHAEDGVRRRKMRPTGSSLFLRWPEFGFGLRRSALDDTDATPEIVDMVAWRGAREDRGWPQHLARGQVGSMPWRVFDGVAPVPMFPRGAA